MIQQVATSCSTYDSHLTPTRLRLHRCVRRRGLRRATDRRMVQDITANAEPKIRVKRGTALEDVPTPDDVAPLFQEFQLGDFQLKHRIVYPPLTRCRAADGRVPCSTAKEYYSQRATAGGLVITEGTNISVQATGYPRVPGIFTEEQIEGWKPVVNAVHEKGAIFFCQLWHCGRASHRDYQERGELPVGPSPLAISDRYQCAVPSGEMKPYQAPRELQVSEVPALLKSFAAGARNAIAAGFDGVEVHGGNGYLLDQFLKDSSNVRTDEYGGSIPNRCRLTIEVVKAVAEAVGPEKVGLRLTPFNSFLDSGTDDPYPLYEHLIAEINPHNLAYLHMVEPRVAGSDDVDGTVSDTLEPFRSLSSSPFIVAGGHSRSSGTKAVASGLADLVAFGRYFIANPDLPKRFKLDAPLKKYDRPSFYISDPVKGYIDQPFLEDTPEGDLFFL